MGTAEYDSTKRRSTGALNQHFINTLHRKCTFDSHLLLAIFDCISWRDHDLNCPSWLFAFEEIHIVFHVMAVGERWKGRDPSKHQTSGPRLKCN